MNQVQIDLRNLESENPHAAVFQAFDALKLGEALALLVDHNPKLLFRQFKSLRPDAFSWEPVEESTNLWRVKIGKISNKTAPEAPEEGCCGICGGNKEI